MYGSKGVAEVVPVAVQLVASQALRPGAPPALGPGPDMVKFAGGEPGGEREPDGSGEESECGLGGGLARRRRDGAG